ncbi:1,4-beta-xylanase, partial [Salinimicrobium sp. CDJ15-91]|nr:1,4-beta-xylanase [Salinimicrobium oceani]
MSNFKSALLTIFFCSLGLTVLAQDSLSKREFQTYCHPIDIDYTYVAHNSYTGVSYRAGADPAVINFKGKYYM